MWFKNLQLYRLDKALSLSPEELHERLQIREFQSCSRMQLSSTGWAPPLGRHGTQLTHAANGFIMLCLRTEEKLIPAGIVRQLVEDKAAEIGAAEMRDVRRSEKLRIKDQVIDELLPHALSRIRDQFAYIDTRNGTLVVDAVSPNRALAFVEMARKTLDELSACPVKLLHAPMDFMTRWLYGERLPESFSLGADCDLKHNETDGGAITCRRHDLSSDEVRQHVRSGMHAVKLALHWKDHLNFILHDDLSIKRLRFEGIIKAQGEDVETDDFASVFDLDFTLMSAEIAAFLPELLEVLGGEEGEETVAPATREPELAEA